MRRRAALARLALGAAAGCVGLVSCARLGEQGADASEGVERLEADLKRLDRSPDLEEGVPMFLLGENLAAGPPETENVSDGEGARLAREFREVAEAFRAMNPGATAADAQKLVELLALRDFGGRRGE